MPEGFNSIADLKVIVDASTEKLHGNLEAAHGLIQKFGADSNSALGGFDRAIQAAGGGMMLMRGHIGLMLSVAEQAVTFLSNFRQEAAAFAADYGATEQYERVMAEVDKTTEAIGTGLADAFEAAKEAAMDYVGGSGEVTTQNLAAADSSAGWADTLEAQLIPRLKEVAHWFRTLAPEAKWSTETIDTEMARLIVHIEELQKNIAAVNSAPGTSGRSARGSTFSQLREDLDASVAKLKELQALAGTPRPSDTIEVPFEIANPAASKGIERLEKEIELLEQKRRMQGMSAGAAEAQIQREKILAEIAESGVEASATQLRRLDELIAGVRRLKDAEEAQVKAKQDATKRQAQEAQLDRAEQMTFGAAERELAVLESRAAALGLNAVEAAKLAKETQILNSLRQGGVAIGDDERVKASAIAESYAQATERLQEMQDRMSEFRAVSTSAVGLIENSFRNWISGTKTDFKGLIASMLEDIAMLTLKKTVLGPLSDALSSGLGSMFGSGGLFGGFRAEGGPVEAGRSYIVGEKGPEMFLPSSGGTIVPNGAGNSPTVVNMPVTINAQGAYPESIADIKKALAEHTQQLPGRIVQVVRESKSRGLV